MQGVNIMNAYLEKVLGNVRRKYAAEPEFVQTVEEVFEVVFVAPGVHLGLVDQKYTQKPQQETDGSAQVEEIDLTDKFNTSLALENQWILLDRKIIIKPIDSGGGMTPGVENWKDIEADIYM